MKLTRFVLLGFSLLVMAGPAAAAKSPAQLIKAAKPAPVSLEGNDVSYPQCNRSLPKGQAFGVVGVTGGLANNTNPCLTAELLWATGSSGAVAAQPKAQLYVNTANPGQLSLVWPTNNTDPAGNVAPNSYGTCDGSLSIACAWQYGWNRAVEDATTRLSTATDLSANAFNWWLDVETQNSWETSTDGIGRNRADLEGMTAYFQSVGAGVGLYSTTQQWQAISGTVLSSSDLAGLNNWRPGARTAKAAASNCALAPLTPGGRLTLTQYTSNNLDYDHSCI